MDIVVPAEFRPLWEQNEEQPVVKYPAEVLRQPAETVERVTKRTRALIDKMLEVMSMANGIGIAAPQLGVSERVVIVSAGERKPMALVNPRITASEGEVVGEEGCLSLPGLYGDVTRASAIELEALDENGKPLRLRMEGMLARVAQHELDHLDGVLFIDKVDIATLHWMQPLARKL